MSQNSDPICTVDPYDYLKIVENRDGTITRQLDFPCTPATPDSTTSPPSKDVIVNPTRNIMIRLYLPSPNPPKKLPLLVYFHGGGFVLLSAKSTPNHDFCAAMAAELNAVVASVEYRLAPEHRLPAAYDDAEESLRWISDENDDWLRNFADLSRCFLIGSSAGGNIAYRVGLRAAVKADGGGGFGVKIRGVILHHPYFGGVDRTESEIRLVNCQTLPLSGNDKMWELALPLGADRDHWYSNPTVGVEDCGVIGRLGWKVLVMGCSGDPLIDRQLLLVEMLKKSGVEAVGEFKEGEYHGVELLELSKAKSMFDLWKGFVNC